MGRRSSGGMGEEAFGFGHVPREDRTIDQRFADFHQDHPEIFELFKKYAAQLYQKGFRRYSADAILHAIRWSYDVRHGPNPETPFPKVNDQFTAHYADLLRRSDTKFAKFFVKKRANRT